MNETLSAPRECRNIRKRLLTMVSMFGWGQRKPATTTAFTSAKSVSVAFDVHLRVVCRDSVQLGELVEQLRAQAGVQETSSSVIMWEWNLKMTGERSGEP